MHTIGKVFVDNEYEDTAQRGEGTMFMGPEVSYDRKIILHCSSAARPPLLDISSLTFSPMSYSSSILAICRTLLLAVSLTSELHIATVMSDDLILRYGLYVNTGISDDDVRRSAVVVDESSTVRYARRADLTSSIDDIDVPFTPIMRSPLRNFILANIPPPPPSPPSHGEEGLPISASAAMAMAAPTTRTVPSTSSNARPSTTFVSSFATGDDGDDDDDDDDDGHLARRYDDPRGLSPYDARMRA